MQRRLITILSAILFLSKASFAQGCSDAGFCTIGHLKQASGEKVQAKHQSISLLLPFGVGDESVFVFTPGIQYDNQLSERWSVQGKLTGNYASGNLGSATGAGDVVISSAYNFRSHSTWNTSVTIGAKLPLNQGDLKENGRSLPMQYQSSLGTVDLITGISVNNDHWQFATGWQQPLSGINRNHFLPIYWNKPEAAKYIPSNDFNRKADVLLRAAYLLRFGKKTTINGGLLGIYHLGQDTYIDAAMSKMPIPISGSDGLTLNATFAAWHQVSSRIKIGLTGGVPLVVRDVRPDGLTRSFVVAPEISFKF